MTMVRKKWFGFTKMVNLEVIGFSTTLRGRGCAKSNIKKDWPMVFGRSTIEKGSKYFITIPLVSWLQNIQKQNGPTARSKKTLLLSIKKASCTEHAQATGPMDPLAIPWNIKKVKKMAMRSGTIPQVLLSLKCATIKEYVMALKRNIMLMVTPNELHVIRITSWMEKPSCLTRQA